MLTSVYFSKMKWPLIINCLILIITINTPKIYSVKIQDKLHNPGVANLPKMNQLSFDRPSESYSPRSKEFEYAGPPSHSSPFHYSSHNLAKSPVYNFQNPFSDKSDDSPSVVYSVPVDSPPESNYDAPSPQTTYDLPNSPSESYDSPNSPETSYDAPSTEAPVEIASTYYGTSDPVVNNHKVFHKFKLEPVLVLFGFFCIMLMWVFLRVGFFKQIGIAGNFKRSLDNLGSTLEEHHSILETLSNTFFKATSKMIQEIHPGESHRKSG